MQDMNWAMIGLVVGSVLVLLLLAGGLGFVLGSMAAKAAGQIGEGGDDD